VGLYHALETARHAHAGHLASTGQLSVATGPFPITPDAHSPRNYARHLVVFLPRRPLPLRARARPRCRHSLWLVRGSPERSVSSESPLAGQLSESGDVAACRRGGGHRCRASPSCTRPAARGPTSSGPPGSCSRAPRDRWPEGPFCDRPALGGERRAEMSAGRAVVGS
jgi:hypothetical protein